MHYSELRWLENTPESRKAFRSTGSDGPEKASGGAGIYIRFTSCPLANCKGTVPAAMSRGQSWACKAETSGYPHALSRGQPEPFRWVGVGSLSTPGNTRMLTVTWYTRWNHSPVPWSSWSTIQLSRAFPDPSSSLCLFWVPIVLYIFTHSDSTVFITPNYRFLLKGENCFIPFWDLQCLVHSWGLTNNCILY